jgi:hypothetical protein
MLAITTPQELIGLCTRMPPSTGRFNGPDASCHRRPSAASIINMRGSEFLVHTSVLFELIGMRYERRSLLITMTLAAIDRLVHHSTIIEMNVESYRRRTAIERKRGPGRPHTRDNQGQRKLTPRDNQRPCQNRGQRQSCARSRPQIFIQIVAPFSSRLPRCTRRRWKLLRMWPVMKKT